jgi:hypothetical protein
MNKYILKVMRYIDNKELFSVEEMRENTVNAAYDDDASAYAAVSAYAAAIAYDEANVAYDYHANTARDWVNEYFKDSDENKQDYVNEVERLK